MAFHQGKVCQELNVILSTYCEYSSFLPLRVNDIDHAIKIFFFPTYFKKKRSFYFILLYIFKFSKDIK